MKSRFQRWLFSIARIPGALPQAAYERCAFGALNSYPTRDDKHGGVATLKHRAAERTIHLSVTPTFAPPLFSFHGETMTTEKATFGAGCFWGVEATFRATRGVTNATVGYAGGTTENPTYEDVCAHGTGHAEVVQVEFDPAIVSYNQLLDVFWSNHNPTTLNRQGPDVGDQYRSVIFYHTPEQRVAAEESKATLDKSGRFKRPIVTQMEPAPTFYPAEDYHQRYLEKRGLSHCAV